MISPSSFNYYQDLLEDIDNYAGCKSYSDEVLGSLMSAMVQHTEEEQE